MSNDIELLEALGFTAL